MALLFTSNDVYPKSKGFITRAFKLILADLTSLNSSVNFAMEEFEVIGDDVTEVFTFTYTTISDAYPFIQAIDKVTLENMQQDVVIRISSSQFKMDFTGYPPATGQNYIIKVIGDK